MIVVTGDGDVTNSGAWPEWEERELGRDGPPVIALTTTSQSLAGA